MRISLYLPVYAPVTYAGQTPVAYKRAAREKFERILAENATNIYVSDPARLDFEAERGEMHRRPVTRYEFDTEKAKNTTAILRAALEGFGLKTVNVAYNVGDMFTLDIDAVEIGIGHDAPAGE